MIVGKPQYSLPALVEGTHLCYKLIISSRISDCLEELHEMPQNGSFSQVRNVCTPQAKGSAHVDEVESGSMSFDITSYKHNSPENTNRLIMETTTQNVL